MKLGSKLFPTSHPYYHYRHLSTSSLHNLIEAALISRSINTSLRNTDAVVISDLKIRAASVDIRVPGPQLRERDVIGLEDGCA